MPSSGRPSAQAVGKPAGRPYAAPAARRKGEVCDQCFGITFARCAGGCNGVSPVCEECMARGLVCNLCTDSGWRPRAQEHRIAQEQDFVEASETESEDEENRGLLGGSIDKRYADEGPKAAAAPVACGRGLRLLLILLAVALAAAAAAYLALKGRGEQAAGAEAGEDPLGPLPLSHASVARSPKDGAAGSPDGAAAKKLRKPRADAAGDADGAASASGGEDDEAGGGEEDAAAGGEEDDEARGDYPTQKATTTTAAPSAAASEAVTTTKKKGRKSTTTAAPGTTSAPAAEAEAATTTAVLTLAVRIRRDGRYSRSQLGATECAAKSLPLAQAECSAAAEALGLAWKDVADGPSGCWHIGGNAFWSSSAGSSRAQGRLICGKESKAKATDGAKAPDGAKATYGAKAADAAQAAESSDGATTKKPRRTKTSTTFEAQVTAPWQAALADITTTTRPGRRRKTTTPEG